MGRGGPLPHIPSRQRAVLQVAHKDSRRGADRSLQAQGFLHAGVPAGRVREGAHLAVLIAARQPVQGIEEKAVLLLTAFALVPQRVHHGVWP